MMVEIWNEVVKLIEVTRGNLVEGIHIGHIVVVGSEGKVLCKLGNPDSITYFRSAAKPLLTIVEVSV